MIHGLLASRIERLFFLYIYLYIIWISNHIYIIYIYIFGFRIINNFVNSHECLSAIINISSVRNIGCIYQYSIVMKSAIPMQVRYHFKKVNEAFSYMHDHAKASLGLKIMEATIQAPSF